MTQIAQSGKSITLARKDKEKHRYSEVLENDLGI